MGINSGPQEEAVWAGNQPSYIFLHGMHKKIPSYRSPEADVTEEM